ncbi:MAG: RraA family protein [Geminicoccaceae bacterium]|nr:RraA family protein [Geminicoccaceae bacterium]
MIHEPPLLRIRRHFERPQSPVMDRLRSANSCWIGDALEGRAGLDPSIRTIGTGPIPVCGPAFTCSTGVNANVALAAAISLAEPGDVIIAANEGFAGAAIIGDVLAGMAKNRGVAGIIIDGFARDLAGLKDVGLPIFARGVTPNSCVRMGVGTVGLPVQAGGQRIDSGDFIFADDDGVVVIARQDIDRTADRIDEIAQAERGVVQRVRDGLDRPDFMVDLLQSDRVQYLD